MFSIVCLLSQAYFIKFINDVVQRTQEFFLLCLSEYEKGMVMNMKKEISLSGCTALVTGGGTGLGFAIAKELKDAGAKIILAGRRKGVLREAAAALGSGATYRVLDLAALDTIPLFAVSLEQSVGPIDILINNAGIQNNKNTWDYTPEEFAALFQVNVFGTYLLTREISRFMAERGRGSIIFITSTAAHIGLPCNMPYSGTKGALSAMVRTFASELSPLGIRVNAVTPGWIESEMLTESFRKVPERKSAVEHRILLNRLGRPEEIGMATAFLVSEASSYITGIELRVDGGISASL